MTMPDKALPEPEFSRSLRVADVPAEGLEVVLRATAGECTALARRFALGALDRLDVGGRVLRTGHGLRVDLRVEATVQQTCVVTLEPVTSVLVDEFACEFRRDVAEDGEFSLHWGEGDPPEPLVNERVDLGDLAADLLGAMIDPYPRRPDLPAPEEGRQEPTQTARAPAFERLKDWPGRRRGG
ncbi:MAG: DUF177 domain-containing protein [Alphaproteobacteria bacterium]|nr:DUF177 domain-containing protein [Alphaproteobacteria bacterium]